jgi:hypothetical protein
MHEEAQLSRYLFPVEETEVYFRKPGGDKRTPPQSAHGHKAIVRMDGPHGAQLIAIQRDSYKMVSNREVIGPLMQELSKLDTPWLIDHSHSFCSNSRMRLQVTFPDMKFHDGRSDIALSLYLSNSYDSSEGVRMFWGAIRGICSNGMIFGKVLAKYYRKHTLNLSTVHLRDQISATYENIPAIKNRIAQLQDAKVTEDVRNLISARIGKGTMKHIEETEEQSGKTKNLWQLYNMCTWYISHEMALPQRAAYQLQVSNIFDL